MAKTKSKSEHKIKNKARGKAKRKADIRIAQGTAADEAIGKAGGELERDKTGRIKRVAYEAELVWLQLELVKLQEYIKEAGLRVVFEGRDAAGKSGAIKRIQEAMNPRVCRIAALPAPSDRERTQWYFQRYVAELPSASKRPTLQRRRSRHHLPPSLLVPTGSPSPNDPP